MKKFIFGLLGFGVFIILAALLIPYFFKDEIKVQIDKQMEKNLDASIYFDTDNFSLSLFSHFPNVTASLDDFGLVGKTPFENDTLAKVNNFELVFDLPALLFQDEIKVIEFTLGEPNIFLRVLPDGRANWDIVLTDSSTVETAKEVAKPTEFAFAVDKWQIKDGSFIYYDLGSNLYFFAGNLNHEGSGDFTQDVVNMTTKTAIGRITLESEGTALLQNKQFTANLNLLADLKNSKYTLQRKCDETQ